jgi:hypothetical protein
MSSGASRVTIHMVASLDGFIARRDGSVDGLETSDTFEGGTPDVTSYKSGMVGLRYEVRKPPAQPFLSA